MGQIRKLCSLCYSRTCAFLIAKFLCPSLKENAFGVKVMLYALIAISCNPNVSCLYLLELSYQDFNKTGLNPHFR